ncbi:glycosyltransferase [Candidatus Pseudothioglobus singularis]|nr:glycosyltransferase [Candidatus Pseudothioglobus singularis]
MSVFNEEHRLPSAIESILKQSYQSWLLILINDGSTDNSQKVINHYVEEDKRITCIVNKSNKGLAYSLNKAIESCNSEFIARMDADDVALQNRLEAQLDFLKDHSEVDVLGTGAEVIYATNHKSTILKPKNHNSISRSIEKINPFFHSSVIMRRSFIESMGGYDVKCLRAQDYDLWLRGIDRFMYHNLQEVLMIYSSRNQSFLSIYYGLRVRVVNAYRRDRLIVGTSKAIMVFVYGIWVKTVRSFK